MCHLQDGCEFFLSSHVGPMKIMMFYKHVHVRMLLKLIGHICVLGFGLKLACNGDLYEGISLTRDECHFAFEKTPCSSFSCKLGRILLENIFTVLM